MISLLQQAPLAVSLGLFAAAAVVIGVFGVRMTHLARDLAEATGLGQAFMGAFLIGGATSLAGITASATAAMEGEASLAVSNSLGGIAAQTVFLVLGDMFHRKYNLEFAAASVENMMLSAQLMIMLGILVLAFALPGGAVLAVHPASLALIVAYAVTLKMLIDAHEKPMWLPRMSRGTVVEGGEPGHRRGPPRWQGRTGKLNLFAQFALCALAVAVSGWILASTGSVIVHSTGLSAGVVGGVLIAIASSLPELVVAVTAIRMGALTLAVGDIVGGNAFDTLFIAVADLFYRDGSIFTAIATTEYVWLGCALLMNAVLLMGLMYRQRQGMANIGLESWTMLGIYLGTVGLLVTL